MLTSVNYLVAKISFAKLWFAFFKFREHHGSTYCIFIHDQPKKSWKLCFAKLSDRLILFLDVWISKNVPFYKVSGWFYILSVLQTFVLKIFVLKIFFDKFIFDKVGVHPLKPLLYKYDEELIISINSDFM